MKILCYFYLPFLFFWELPQNLLGIFVLGVLKNRHRIKHIQFDRHRFFVQTVNTSVSLGNFVFWSPLGNRYANLVNDCRMHEYGHARQSAILGPFYLLIIGIPSMLRVLYSLWYLKKHGVSWKNYFKGFPENWADKLGEITEIKQKKLS